MLVIAMAALAPPADAATGEAYVSVKARLRHASQTPIGLQSREEGLRDAVNAERRRNGLAPLGIDRKLQRDARAHTTDMIRFGYFGHQWHDGTHFRIWIARRTSCAATGEILAWHSPQQTPENAVRQWLDSPSHRALLLSSTWSVMGVELRQRHATVDFGKHC